MQVMRSIETAGSAVLATLFALMACFAGGALAADPIKIGFGHSLTGGNGPLGKASLLTFQIWAEEVNARGGLLGGRKVELIYYDDQSNPSNVPGLYNKLIEVDKVDVLMSQGTIFTAPAMPVVMQNNRFLLASLSLAVNDQFKYNRYFQTMPYGSDGKAAISKGYFEVAAKLNPKPRTIAFIGADIEFARNALDGARAGAKKAGLTIVYDQSYPASTVDFSSIMRAIQSKKPDLVFVGSYPIDSAGLVRAAREVGLKSMMFGGAMVGLQITTVKQQMGENLNGMVNYELFLREPTMSFPGVNEFLTKYRARAGAAGTDPLGLYVAPVQYATAQVLEQAITATGGTDDAKLADYLHKTTFKTIFGEIKFGADGEWANSRILMTQFQKVKGNDMKQFDTPGTQVILYPESLKSGELKSPFPIQ
ncbi:MAG: branched-chain amino acid transporter substrate binding protein [Betaproteobacteria bacterium]|nr:branched-chain amino acid transporter substrate binding protein [Betaproteobacteria bacterium]